MDQAQLALLSDQQRERYRILEGLFGHPGWAIIEDFAARSAEDQLFRAANAKDWETHQKATGARAAYIQLAQLRQATENEYEELAAQVLEAQEARNSLKYE